MEILFTNPALTILVVLIVVIIGKEFFLKKDDGQKIEREINGLSSRIDNSNSGIKQEFIGALHNHELKNKDEFSLHSDKFYKELDRLSDKMEQKYVSKEINKRQEERIEILEKAICEIRGDISEMKPHLEQIDILCEMVKELMNKK